MDEKGQTKNSSKMHATILGVIGIILVIVGAAIVAIPGAPMRGSGIGTASIVLGVVLLIIALLRFTYKRA
jgi:hypothetical protein